MSDSRSYDDWHEARDADMEARDPWYELVKESLRGRPLMGQRVLEIGCGRGGFACWLAKQATRPAEIVAVDFSPVAVEKGKELAGRSGVDGITWRVGDIQAIAEPEHSFDTVISCETIEHVPDPAQAVRELARVLRPGGALLLTVPNYLGSYGLYRAFLRLTGRRFTEVGQPINHFTTLPLVRHWVRRAGLEIVKTVGVGHYAFRPGRPPRRLRLLDGLPLGAFALHSHVVAFKPTGSLTARGTSPAHGG